MSNTLTIRLPDELASWLRALSAQSGIPLGRLVREELEKARARDRRRGYMRLAGTVRGARDLSRRRGFSR